MKVSPPWPWDLQPCQCEHKAHFDPAVRTPNDNPGHHFGANHIVREVTTPYGTFHVCKDCAEDCYGQF